MTYKLNPALAEIKSSIILLLPDGEIRKYSDSKALTLDVFENGYLVDSMCAVDNQILIQLASRVKPDINCIGEEEYSFF